MNRDDLDHLADRITTGMDDPLDRADLLDALDLDALALDVQTEHGDAWRAMPLDDLRRMVTWQLAGPRAATACPVWCSRRPGHPFADGTGHALTRYHQGPTHSTGPLHVHLTQREDAATPTGPSLYGPILADIWTDDTTDPHDWTPAALRAAAATIQATAAAAEAATIETST